MFVKQLVVVLSLAALVIGTNVNKGEEEHPQETARFSIIDEFEKLTSGTKSLFSDMNTLRNSPVMQSLLSRLMQRGNYMTQLPVEKKEDKNKGTLVQRVENVQNVVTEKSAVVTQAPASDQKKSGIAQNTKDTYDPSKYFKMGDITIAGAMGLGALALGALIASPVVGAGILSRSDDDPTVASKKSWLDSLAFWKEDKDGESFYEVPVAVDTGYDQNYNPYYDLGDGTGYDPSIIKYEDDNDFYLDYNDEGTRLDKNGHKKSYYSNYAAENYKQDKSKKKKTYYSDEEFWNDHYFKDGVIYERGSNVASPYSYNGASGYNSNDSKKKGSKRPYTRGNHYYSADYDSTSEGSYYVQDSYSFNDQRDKQYAEEDKDKVYITVNEINKIANDSLKDILRQYQHYLGRVSGSNVAYADVGTEDYVGSSNDRSQTVYGEKVNGGDRSNWEPLEIYSGYNDWNSRYQFLKNHRIPSSETVRERVNSEPLKQQQQVDEPKPRIRRPHVPKKIEPSQPDYKYQRNSNRERHIYAAAQVDPTTTTDPTPRRNLYRKTTEQEATTIKNRITRDSNISKTPSEKESFPTDILVKELTDYQKAYTRRFGSR